MRGKLIVKHAEGVIEMSREFAKYSAVAGSDEYNLLQQTRRDYPTYRVVRKQIKKNKDTAVFIQHQITFYDFIICLQIRGEVRDYLKAQQKRSRNLDGFLLLF